MITFTSEKIQELTLHDMTSLRENFPTAVWADEYAVILTEVHEAAGTSERDPARLVQLHYRASNLIRDHKLKGLTPILWMIASLSNTSE